MTRLVDEMPELSVILDHLGNPPLGLGAEDRSVAGAPFRRWERNLQELGSMGAYLR